MKKLLFLASLVCIIVSCEQNPDYKIGSEYIATIVGFDLNCSTCILEFPYDNSQIKKEIGESPSNFYHTINLSKGDYEIGQKVRVKLRKAETNELTPCIALYPSYSYKNVFITEFEDFSNLIFNDTIELSYRQCLYNPEDHFYICLDSVLNDSRCPTGVMCIWEGNAEVKFKFEKLNENPIFFNLNTHSSFTKDTIIDRYKISLVGVNPYPGIGIRYPQNIYKAKLIIKKN
jgi:hypothetical protein